MTDTADEIQKMYKCALKGLRLYRMPISPFYMGFALLSPVVRNCRKVKLFFEENMINEFEKILEIFNMVENHATQTTTQTTTRAETSVQDNQLGRNTSIISLVMDDLDTSNEMTSGGADEVTRLQVEYSSFKIMPVDTNADTLNFWKTHASHFPLLARIARKTLALHAASTQPERTFSHAGVILNHRRSMMSNHRAEELVFSFENRNLIHCIGKPLVQEEEMDVVSNE